MKGISIFCGCWWGYLTINQIAYLMGAVDAGLSPFTTLCACILSTLLFVRQSLEC